MAPQRITIRRDTLANWAASGAVPLKGEPVVVEDASGALSYKIGDGTRTVPQLPALSKGDKGEAGSRGPQGLPGVNGVENDQAVAGYVGTTGTSATKTALDARYLSSAQKATDPIVGGKPVQKVEANTWFHGLNVLGNNDGMAPDPRQPFQVNVVIDGDELDATTGTYGSNKTGMVSNIGFKGGFSGEKDRGVADPTIIFGEVVFTYTGSAAGDLDGITAYYAQTSEAHMYTPGAQLGTMIGLETSIGAHSSAVGAKITNAFGLYARGPSDDVGDVIENSYAAYFEAPTGGKNRWSARFAGRAQFDATAFFAGLTPSTATATPGTYVGRDSGSGSAVAFLNGTSDIEIGNSLANQFEVREANTSVMLSVSRAGYLSINGGFSLKPSTTGSTPSAGGAGQLPATPAGYMTVRINGTDRQVAYY